MKRNLLIVVGLMSAIILLVVIDVRVNKPVQIPTIILDGSAIPATIAPSCQILFQNNQQVVWEYYDPGDNLHQYLVTVIEPATCVKGFQLYWIRLQDGKILEEMGIGFHSHLEF